MKIELTDEEADLLKQELYGFSGRVSGSVRAKLSEVKAGDAVQLFKQLYICA